MIYPPVITAVSSMRAWRQGQFTAGRSVALVPTMGALHEGHLTLIRSAAAHHPNVVVSIFVNPAQFAPHEDLDSYPRTLAADMQRLVGLNIEFAKSKSPGAITAIFTPMVADMYPSGIPLEVGQQSGAFVSVTPLSERLEGVTRPHFFRGVATMCVKLFNIVQPQEAYFGQKDVQQTVVIKKVLRDLHFPTQLKVVETVREEPDGLAMSSRNVYLTGKRRQVAPCLYQALKAAEEAYVKEVANGAKTVDRKVLVRPAEEILKNAGALEGIAVETDYLSVASVDDLDELENIDVSEGAIISGAVKIPPTEDGERPVRIIDNLILEGRR